MSDFYFLLLPVILLVAVVVIYNGIIGKFNAVDRAWASVLTQERQKNKIIPHVEKLVEEYKLHESSVLADVTRLRNSIDELGKQSSAAPDTVRLAEAERHTASLLQGLKVAVEAYPELKASDLYMKLMAEISEQQEQIGAALRIFNRNVEEFNNAIQMFPGSLVNSLLNHKQPVQSFTDAEAQDGFDYKPNL
ncbi:MULTISPECIES: LemA family protein [Oceanospirillaceae]|uniref:LemA family protein n=1 Tax=Oceanospirillaceae TaxID=135620 RepID=UPI0011944D26|nr:MULTISPECIES: LemA family protein [Thalassolituus]MCB2384928.1 LemA family protein [Thalassolituus alkanivorans]MCB2424825.1 LemA family protein [Thalassolituus alkanivorans]TVV45821.1 LemA family protein [Thalassolituus sp. C2-1]